jgi:hypothetical protein
MTDVSGNQVDPSKYPVGTPTSGIDSFPRWVNHQRQHPLAFACNMIPLYKWTIKTENNYSILPLGLHFLNSMNMDLARPV